MTECVFKWVKDGDVMIGVNTPGKFNDDVWSEFLADFSVPDYKVYIGCTLGILEVSSKQRKASAVALRQNGASVIVITDEVLVRGVVTAVSWLGVKVKSFAWSDFDRALQYSELSGRKAAIMAHVDTLRDEVRGIDEERRKKRRADLQQMG